MSSTFFDFDPFGTAKVNSFLTGTLVFSDPTRFGPSPFTTAIDLPDPTRFGPSPFIRAIEVPGFLALLTLLIFNLLK